MSKIDSDLEFDLLEWRSGLRSRTAATPMVSIILLANNETAARKLCGRFRVFICSITSITPGSWRVIAEAPMKSIERMLGSNAVVFIRSTGDVEPDLDRSRQFVKVPQDNSTPSNDRYTGNNALIGVIDSGFNIFHDGFRNSNGETRIEALWIIDPKDKAKNAEKKFRKPAPAPFAYGSYYDRADLDFVLKNLPTGTSAKSLYRQKMMRSDIIRHIRKDGSHGTHVAGIAGGNGARRKSDGNLETGPFVGIARDAEFILVASPRADHVLADAVGFIDLIAKGKTRKPSAINISMSGNLGPHTPSWPVASELAEASRKSNFVTVGAIGNAANKNMHAAGRLGGTDKATVKLQIDYEYWGSHSNYRIPVIAEIWAGYGQTGAVKFDVKTPAGAELNNITVGKDLVRRRGKHPFAVKAHASPFDPDFTCLWIYLWRSKSLPNDEYDPWEFTITRTDGGSGQLGWHFFAAPRVLKRAFDPDFHALPVFDIVFSFTGCCGNVRINSARC